MDTSDASLFHNLETEVVNDDFTLQCSNTYRDIGEFPAEFLAECSSTYESTKILLTPLEPEGLLEYSKSFDENTEKISTVFETDGVIDYNSTCENTDIIPPTVEIGDKVEYIIPCENTETVPTPCATEDVIEYNNPYNKKTEITSMEIEGVECNNTYGNNEIVAESVVECYTEPELCFQSSSHSLDDPDLVVMKPVVNTGHIMTSHESSLQHEKKVCEINSKNELCASVPTISNTLDISQAAPHTCETNTLSDSFLDLPRLEDKVVGAVLQENKSHDDDAKSNNFSTIEKMDSTISYNIEAQKADLSSSSNKEMSISGDQALKSSLEHSGVEDKPNGISNGITETVESCLGDMKQEPYDSEYESSNLIYRTGTRQVDSDDDTSSTMFSKNSGDGSDAGNDASDEEVVVERLYAREIAMSKNGSRTEGEIFPEELPPIEYLVISPGEDVVVEPVGTVSGVVGVLVIVKGDQNSPALYDDTVLFVHGRQPLGLIFEIFGTVEQPYYSVRFNSSKDIRDKDIAVGNRVFFAPRADNLTKYVFISELKKIKCDDASWENDNEPPPSHVEFSDDEEERIARQRLRNRNRGAAENHGDFVHKKRRKKKRHSENGKDTPNPHGPQLLQGDLNRNPFGSKDHKFSSSATNRWPNSDSHGPVGNGHGFSGHRPNFSPRSSPQPSSFGGFRKPWAPRAGFGERPDWNCHSGIMPGVQNAPRMSGPPRMESFGNRNTFSPQQFRPFPQFDRMPYPSAPGHGPCLPQSSMPPQIPRFVGGGPYLPRPNSQHFNTSLPPPPGLQAPPPHCFPAFNTSLPPPVVNSVFNIPPPRSAL